MATASKKTTGFENLECPFCMAEGANVTLNLSDMECNCPECGEDFTPEKARDKAAKTLDAWQKVVRMVEFGRELAAE